MTHKTSHPHPHSPDHSHSHPQGHAHGSGESHSHGAGHSHARGSGHSHSQGAGHSHHHGEAHGHHHAPSPAPSHAHGPGHAHQHVPIKRSATFSKIFRWKPETAGGPLPVRVEVVGSFNGWQKVPLKYDRTNGVWQATLHDLPGNCTHNYMLLVNGRPTACKNSDGLAVPHTPEEKQYQLETPRGPRVFMLFSQTK